MFISLPFSLEYLSGLCAQHSKIIREKIAKNSYVLRVLVQVSLIRVLDCSVSSTCVQETPNCCSITPVHTGTSFLPPGHSSQPLWSGCQLSPDDFVLEVPQAQTLKSSFFLIAPTPLVNSSSLMPLYAGELKPYLQERRLSHCPGSWGNWAGLKLICSSTRTRSSHSFLSLNFE